MNKFKIEDMYGYNTTFREELKPWKNKILKIDDDQHEVNGIENRITVKTLLDGGIYLSEHNFRMINKQLDKILFDDVGDSSK